MVMVNNKDHNEYFVQSMHVDRTYQGIDRLQFFIPLVKNKRVLHVGFVDWPITSPHSSLHLNLSPHCQIIDGIDIHTEGAESLKVPNGNMYFDWTKVPTSYDVIICPEVIEHADSPRELMQTLDKISGDLIITAPCAYNCRDFFAQNGDTFVEVVHPDHNVWYSPYTLKNTIQKYSTRRVRSLHFLGTTSIAAVAV